VKEKKEVLGSRLLKEVALVHPVDYHMEGRSPESVSGETAGERGHKSQRREEKCNVTVFDK